MTSLIKQAIKKSLPPFVFSALKKVFKRSSVEYWGDFPDWESAKKAAGSYDEPQVFERVKEARLKVMRGEAAYERDGITFSEVHYFYPVLACLLHAATKNNNKLNVLDYGGSLGTSYFQHKELLKHVDVRWNIIEQSHYVSFGKEHVKDSRLHFYDSLEACLRDTEPNVVFISSVLQYLEDPYAVLRNIKKQDVDYVIFDRTTVLPHSKDRIVVQNVPRKIFPTDFPAHLFNEQKLIDFFKPEYSVVLEFPSIGDPITLDTGAGRNKGYYFVRTSK